MGMRGGEVISLDGAGLQELLLSTTGPCTG